MSHLVMTHERIQSKSILSIPCRQVIVPKYRSVLKEQKNLNKNSQALKQQFKQQIMLKALCEKLTEKQLRKLQIQNQGNLRKKFNKIKSRLKNSQFCKGNESQVVKYFQGRVAEKDLSSLLRSNTSNIQIGPKYQHKLTNKLLSIKQARQIQQKKQRYKSWLNSFNNSPLKSPNYNKMNFVLQKVGKNKDLDDLFCDKQNCLFEKSDSLSNIKYLRKLRCSDKSEYNPTISTHRSRGEYLPKSSYKFYNSQANQR